LPPDTKDAGLQTDSAATAKTHGIFYFDVVSPFAYLLHATLSQCKPPIDFTPCPVLFAALLNALGQKGPAEIPAKRVFTYEYCTWLARQRNIPFKMPASHPFNPVRYLRLIIALGSGAEVISKVFATLFATGLDPQDDATFMGLAEELGASDVHQRISAAAVKDALRANTECALLAGVFGVPTMIVNDKLFWGLDSLPMLAAYVGGDGFFETDAMTSLKNIRVGASR